MAQRCALTSSQVAALVRGKVSRLIADGFVFDFEADGDELRSLAARLDLLKKKMMERLEAEDQKRWRPAARIVPT